MSLPETTPVFIYGLCDPRTGELRYVGKTNNWRKRYNEHLQTGAWKKNTHCNSWIKSLLRDNLKPELFIIEESDSENWIEAERFWIAYFRFVGCRLTNLYAGGTGCQHIPAETRAKKIASSPKVRYFSPEVRAKISATHKGKKLSPEHREKFINSVKGKKRSAEFCQKMSDDRKGIPLGKREASSQSNKRRWASIPPEQRSEMRKSACTRRYVGISPQGEIFAIDNMAKFSRDHNLRHACCLRVARGDGIQHKGWKFQYADLPHCE